MPRPTIFSQLFPGKKASTAPQTSKLNVEPLETLIMPTVSGRFPRPVPPPVAVVGTTNTGLDQIVKTIVNDVGLRKNVAPSEIAAGAKAADSLNKLIVDAIRQTGLGNDGTLNTADLRDINAYIRKNHRAEWAKLHGYEIGRFESGFLKVRGDGATSRLFGRNAVDSVADGIFHLGFAIKGNSFVDERGKANVPVETVAGWLNKLLAKDLAGTTLQNQQLHPYAEPSTGTGLDQLVTIIAADRGLNRALPTSEITGGANAADGINALIISAIKATKVADDNTLSNNDVRTVSAYIRANAKDQWADLFGKYQNGVETGFHKVQFDGATSRLFGRNAVDAIANGIYHLGSEISKNRFVNEDGSKGVGVEDVGGWLRKLLAQDLANGKLHNETVELPVAGTTNTSLDAIVNAIANDDGLKATLSTHQMNVSAKAADDLDLRLLMAITNTFVAVDGSISEDDVITISNFIRTNYQSLWDPLFASFLTGRDHGATSSLLGLNVVQDVATSIFLVGAEPQNGTFTSGALTTNTATVASYLNQLLSAELSGGYFAPNS